MQSCREPCLAGIAEMLAELWQCILLPKATRTPGLGPQKICLGGNTWGRNQVGKAEVCASSWLCSCHHWVFGPGSVSAPVRGPRLSSDKHTWQLLQTCGKCKPLLRSEHQSLWMEVPWLFLCRLPCAWKGLNYKNVPWSQESEGCSESVCPTRE